MLTIHGRINSINVQKVALACEELKLPYVRHDAGGALQADDEERFNGPNRKDIAPGPRLVGLGSKVKAEWLYPTPTGVDSSNAGSHRGE